MVTAEELLNDPQHRYNELIAGDTRPLNLPMNITADARRSIALALWLAQTGMYILEQNLGRFYGVNVGFWLKRSPDTVKAPDYAFVKQDVFQSSRSIGFVLDTPNLVVESAQDALLPVKIHEWHTLGTQYVIDLNAIKQMITVYRLNHDPLTLTQADIFTADDILPGFTLPLSKVFPADE